MSNLDEDPNAPNLTDEQQQLLLHFSEITNLGVTASRTYLQNCNWNIDTSISLYFAANEGRTDAPGPTATVSSSLQTESFSHVEPTAPITAPIQPYIPNMIFLGMNFGRVYQFLVGTWAAVMKVGTSIFLFFVTILFPYLRPTPDFNLVFDNRYPDANPHVNFFKGPFHKAVEVAKSSNKVVVLYLDTNSEAVASATSHFCKNVLTNGRVMEAVTAKGMCWGANVSLPAAAQLAKALRVSAYPYVAFMLVPDGNLSLIGTVVGHIEVEAFLSGFAAAVQQVEVIDRRRQTEVSRREEDRLLRDMQDKAYEETKQSHLKMKEEKEMARKIAKEKETAKLAEEEAKRLEMEAVTATRQRLADDFNAAPKPTEPICTIGAKLASGKRIQRPFSATDKLQRVFDWLTCAEILYPEQKLRIPVKFRLSKTFPTVALTEVDKSLDELGLVPNAVVVVQAVDDED
eukprot:Platyproteum_vivax@DN7043_c0_g1_i1.p1